MPMTFDLYVASCTKNGGIYKYRISDENPPKLISFAPMDRPMYMIKSGKKMHVLLRAPFENGESGLVSYDFDENNDLSSPTKPISTKGRVACHLCCKNDSIFAANYVSGSVFKSDGTLITHTGSGVNLPRQESAHTHFVYNTPDDKYLCVCDLALDKIFIYDDDLREISSVDMPKGHGPRHLAFHKDKKHVFCANELASTLSVLKYSDGKMTLIDTISTLQDGFEGENYPAAIRCENNTVFVSNRGHNSVSVINFDSEKQKLTLQNTFSCGGNWPRDLIIHQDLAIVANEYSHNVSIISLKDFKEIQRIDVRSALCLCV